MYVLKQGYGQTAEECKKKWRKRERRICSDCKAIGVCISRKGTNSFQPKRRVQVRARSSTVRKETGKKTLIWSGFNPLILKSAVSLHRNSRIVPKKYFDKRAMGSPRSLGLGEECVQSQRRLARTQSNILLSFGCVVSSCAIIYQTRRKRVCCRFRALHGHAEQEGRT